MTPDPDRDPGLPRLPPRPPRPFFVHWMVDSAIAFLAVLFLVFVVGVPIIPVVIASFVVGLIAAPYTRRAEIRGLAAREATDDELP